MAEKGCRTPTSKAEFSHSSQLSSILLAAFLIIAPWFFLNKASSVLPHIVETKILECFDFGGGEVVIQQEYYELGNFLRTCMFSPLHVCLKYTDKCTYDVKK